MGQAGYIYLIHFDEGLVVRTEPNGTIVYARHYIGWTGNHDQRLAEHDAGRGSSLMAAVKRAGISWRVVRMWEGTRSDERKIKRCRNAPRYCPVCKEERGDQARGLDDPGLPEIQLGGSQMEVKKYRKKPVEVEAVQWDGSLESIKAICDWANRGFGELDEEHPVSYLTNNEEEPFDVLVWTLNGDVQLKPGEWVVRGIEGEFYPCTDDIFKQTYSESLPERNERILVVEGTSPEFGDVAQVVGSSVPIADADLVLVVNDEKSQAIKHRDRLPEEVEVTFARRSLAERMGDSPEQRIMDER